MMIKYVFSVLLLLSLSFSTHAKLIQILHTNDIHSHFEHSIHDKERGGYARLKAAIDRLKQGALHQGIPTVVVDAGDFAEGSFYYKAAQGRRSFELHDSIGFDVVTMGNHDYLMGTKELNRLLGEVKPRFPFLAANVEMDSDRRYEHIVKYLKDYHVVEVDGVKLAFYGLTTNEVLYTWRLEWAKVSNPYIVSKRMGRKLEKEGFDAVIALTHVGLEKDKKIAEGTSGIDMVIGGHSHHALSEPVWVDNRKQKRKIPVFQAGKHAEFVGRIILDFQPGKKVKVIHSELIPVRGELDYDIDQKVQSAKDELFKTYGEAYLNQVVATSGLAPNNYESQKTWSFYVTDALMEHADAEAGAHSPHMTGENYPVGAITRFDLFNAHPRFFEMDKHHGWKVYTSDVGGGWISIVLKTIVKYALPVTFSGIEFTCKPDSATIYGGCRPTDIKINGEPLTIVRRYKVAFPEGIIRGAFGITDLAGAVFHNVDDENGLVLNAIENKLVRDGGVSSSYLKDSGTIHFYFDGKMSGKRVY